LVIAEKGGWARNANFKIGNAPGDRGEFPATFRTKSGNKFPRVTTWEKRDIKTGYTRAAAD